MTCPLSFQYMQAFHFDVLICPELFWLFKSYKWTTLTDSTGLNGLDPT